MEKFVLRTTEDLINNQIIECCEPEIIFRVVDYKNAIDEDINIDAYEDVPLFTISADNVLESPFYFYLAVDKGDNLPFGKPFFDLVKEAAEFYCSKAGLVYKNYLIVLSANPYTYEGYDPNYGMEEDEDLFEDNNGI